MSDKITAMRQGGAKLKVIKKQLADFAVPGKTFMDVENEAQRLIKAAGAVPNFSLVPGYHWAICINKNEGIVHGIPTEKIVINSGDLISIDLGLLWQGWNLDTSISFAAGQSNHQLDYFLQVGQHTLDKTITHAVAGNSVYDLSRVIEKTIKKAGFSPSFQLAGHYIGKELHEEPLIPCVPSKSDRKKILAVGDTVAIEVMYAQGDCDLVLAADGWTYETYDRSLTGLFEETILITDDVPEILT